MSIELFDTQYICSHYMPAIINGDYSGLSDDDEKRVNDWLDTIPACASFDYLDETSFCRDKITGLLADCFIVNIFAEQSHIDALAND